MTQKKHKDKGAGEFLAELEARKKSYLEANGWKMKMFHWYWVWVKTFNGQEFMCFNEEQALTTENVIQQLGG